MRNLFRIYDEEAPELDKPRFYQAHFKRLFDSGKVTTRFLKTLSEKGYSEPIWARLACFDDVGGKKRYVALGNWMLQGVLKPLHDLLMFILRMNRRDCTYHQEKIFD